jgi:hypothetical protein
MAAHFWLKTNWQSVENLASHFPSTPLLWSIFCGHFSLMCVEAKNYEQYLN